MITPDEKCSCTCGGPDAEDHTPGVGCERRGCTCCFWPQDNGDILRMFEDSHRRFLIAASL